MAQIISILQHSTPIMDIRVRQRFLAMLRTTIFVLKEKRPHSPRHRSSSTRLPDFGGLGRSSSAVTSWAAWLYACMQMPMLNSTMSSVMPHAGSETGARSFTGRK